MEPALEMYVTLYEQFVWTITQSVSLVDKSNQDFYCFIAIYHLKIINVKTIHNAQFMFVQNSRP